MSVYPYENKDRRHFVSPETFSSLILRKLSLMTNWKHKSLVAQKAHLKMIIIGYVIMVNIGFVQFFCSDKEFLNKKQVSHALCLLPTVCVIHAQTKWKCF
jgi:hypothetical protein